MFDLNTALNAQLPSLHFTIVGNKNTQGLVHSVHLCLKKGNEIKSSDPEDQVLRLHVTKWLNQTLFTQEIAFFPPQSVTFLPLEKVEFKEDVRTKKKKSKNVKHEAHI